MVRQAPYTHLRMGLWKTKKDGVNAGGTDQKNRNEAE